MTTRETLWQLASSLLGGLAAAVALSSLLWSLTHIGAVRYVPWALLWVASFVHAKAASALVIQQATREQVTE